MRRAPDFASHAHELEEKKILTALLHRGPLSFHGIHRKVLPDLPMRRVDNAVRRLANADQIVTSDRGPKVWSLTDAGRARLGLPPFHARVGEPAERSTA